MATGQYTAIVVKSDSDISWMSGTGTGKTPMTVSGPIAALNQAGQQGWEVISAETPSHGSWFWGYGDIVYTLKRPLP